MHWLKRSLWKAGIALAGSLLVALGMWLMVIVVWAPVSAAGTYERASGIAGPGTVTLQTPSTADLTVTAVAQDKLKQEDEQLQRGNSFPWTVLNTIGGPMLAALAAISVAFFGLYQWRGNLNAEREKEIATQDKELRDRAEDRFKTAVTALGDEKEGAQVGGVILLRSFLNKDDEKTYARYYTQIFDLAVSYLHLPRTSNPPEDPDGLPRLPEDSNAPLPLTTLRQALIVVFKEAFPLARSQNKGDSQSLDATAIQLDNAYLSGTDLQQVWMPGASMRGSILSGTETNLSWANLSGADLSRADLQWINLSHASLPGADLSGADLSGANLYDANLSEAKLLQANLHDAGLEKAKFNGADLRGSGLSGASLGEADFSGAKLNGADFSGVRDSGPYLRGPKLNGANLSGADLSGADLSGADFSGAVLIEANLSGAKLNGANLSQTSLEYALAIGPLPLKGTDLRGVKGQTREQLEACKAKGAIIDEVPTTSAS